MAQDILFKPKSQSLRFNPDQWQRIKAISDKIYNAANLGNILATLKDEIPGLFAAERLTIYMIDGINRQLVSRFVTGPDISEIRLPISSQSMAGFACSHQQLVNVADAYNENELSRLDPLLKFDQRWDRKTGYRTRQALVVPINFKNLQLGVLQLINRKNQLAFSRQDEDLMHELVKILGHALYTHNRLRAAGKHEKFEYLLKNHFLSRKELKAAMARGEKEKLPVEEVLIRDFFIAKLDILKALSHYYSVDYIEFKRGLPQPKELLSNLNKNYLKTNFWVPLRQEGDTIAVVIDNPLNLHTTDHIQHFFPGRSLRYCVALKQDILALIDDLTAPKREIEDMIKEETELPAAPKDKESTAEDQVTEESSVVVRMVNKIVQDAYGQRASDIHIEPIGEKDIKIRFRVDGVCSVYQRIPASFANPIVSRIKIMAGLDIAERRKPQDGKIRFNKFSDQDIELRVATLPTQGGLEDVVLRILAAGKPIPLARMGLSERNYDNFTNAVTKPYGLIFVCGPTGSGKTTTLHSALNFINTDERKIWTAEDPVEITQEGLRQVQVKPKIGLDFASVMRSFLRADPDVIMVGEMRDRETTAIGIEASLTGHLVFSTLHTNSAPESITRLLDMGMDPFNFADAILCIMAQRLTRTLCPDCKTAYPLSEEAFNELAREYIDDTPSSKLDLTASQTSNLYRATGCERCNQTGYRGRMGLHELLMGTDPMKHLIQNKAPMGQIRSQAIADGMTTLKQDGIGKILAGHTDLMQVRKVCIK